jgi:single-strand DNA-binding protein
MWHKIFLIGNLGREPEMRYTPSGQAVTSFSVAVDDSYTGNDGQRVKRTIWVRISAWGKQAETCNQYLHKGSKVLVEGRLQPDQATGGPRVFNRQDGTTGSSYEVVAQTVRFLTPKGEGEAMTGEETPSVAGEEEIPF